MRNKIWIFLMAMLVLMGCGGNADKIQNAESGVTAENGNGSNVTNDIATESETEQQVYVLEFTDAVTAEGEVMSADVFAASKLTMVNVWATFCGPCINEMPDLGEISKSYDKTEFQMIGIISDTVEGDEEMLSEAKDIIEETGADYPHLLLNEELYVNLVGASDSVPTTYFFNQKGELLGYLVGAQSKGVWEEIINELLGEME